MKVTLVFLCCVVVAMAAKTCGPGLPPCTCHGAGEVANCEDHVCTCVATGPGKRAACTTDADCADHACHMGNATCVLHGSAEHGHMNCACEH